MSNDIDYTFWPGEFVLHNETFLEECASFYSHHYGIWGSKGVRPGENVQLSAKKLSEWLSADDTYVYVARKSELLVGYAIALVTKSSQNEIITWVTQLVVHKEHRHRGVAKNLLFSIWGFSDHYAWGIVSANPYAVRALEKATRRRAYSLRIKKNSKKIRHIGENSVPYINEQMELVIDENNSKINTSFFVDHQETINALDRVATNDNPWTLGMIDDGWEWFAFTFHDQEKIHLSTEEIERMISTADSVVKNAYGRMILNPNYQKWMSHTIEEVDYIVKRASLKDEAVIYDIGCGQGRHALEFANRGYRVTGVDYLKESIDSALIRANESNCKVDFVVCDCRNYKNNVKADLVVCLYDVIGSYADDSSNRAILKSIFDLLKSGGVAVISVMNYEMTINNAKYTFSFKKNANKLLDLIASDTMQTTGEVFNPDFYMVDVDEHIVYRREQFRNGNLLPVELIVRDRRYTMEEIRSMCEEIGFVIKESKYTHASDWEDSYGGDDNKAKEILLICKKP